MQSSLDKFLKRKSSDESSSSSPKTKDSTSPAHTGTDSAKTQQVEDLKSHDDLNKNDEISNTNNNEKGLSQSQNDLKKPTTRNVMKRGISIAVVPHRKQDITEPEERMIKKPKIKPTDQQPTKEISSEESSKAATTSETTKKVKFDESVNNNESTEKKASSRPVLSRSKTTPITNPNQRVSNNNNNNKPRNEDSDTDDQSVSSEESESSSEESTTTKDRSKSVIKHEYITPTGQKIQVRHGDLTQEDTDTIVNAANGALAHGAGVAGAVVRAGGPTIQRESDKWIDKYGSVDTGDVAVTSGGNMMCKYVIHAVGPVWYGGKRNEKKDLYSCVTNSLQKATELKLTSIALPAISSGIFGFPRDMCAKIMFDSALKFCETHPDTTVKQIRFTNIDNPTVSVFCSEFVSRFESPNDSDE